MKIFISSTFLRLDVAQHYANENVDTRYTKMYVGGLPWETRNEGLRSYFEQFGDIIHVNMVCDRETGRSEGYGFVMFRDAESATRACQNPKPVIDGREAKCNLAYIGGRVNNNQNAQQQQVPTYVPNWDQFPPPQYHTYTPYGYWTPHGPYYVNQPGPYYLNQPGF
ncbi:putative RNA recognition motif domain, nucleotide-binding alpha-beta plait domain superfamily [Arabidopsis thaliana]